jgi:hypothetical protein
MLVSTYDSARRHILEEKHRPPSEPHISQSIVGQKKLINKKTAELLCATQQWY